MLNTLQNLWNGFLRFLAGFRRFLAGFTLLMLFMVAFVSDFFLVLHFLTDGRSISVFGVIFSPFAQFAIIVSLTGISWILCRANVDYWRWLETRSQDKPDGNNRTGGGEMMP